MKKKKTDCPLLVLVNRKETFWPLYEKKRKPKKKIRKKEFFFFLMMTCKWGSWHLHGRRLYS